MPPENTGIDVSEVREDVDAIQVVTPEGVSEVQDFAMGYTEEDKEINPEEVRYRVTMSDWGVIKNDVYDEFFMDYYSASARYHEVCEDEEFIKNYKSNIVVTLCKAYRGVSQIYWEVIRKNLIYDTSKK